MSLKDEIKPRTYFMPLEKCVRQKNIVWQERQKVLDAMFNQRITNYALAKKLGVKLSVLGNWLSGRKIPDSLERKKIYDVLGL